MKRETWKVKTEALEIHVIRDVPEHSDFQGSHMKREPEAFLLVGRPGQELARVTANDAALLQLALERLNIPGAHPMYTLGRPPFQAPSC